MSRNVWLVPGNLKRDSGPTEQRLIRLLEWHSHKAVPGSFIFDRKESEEFIEIVRPDARGGLARRLKLCEPQEATLL